MSNDQIREGPHDSGGLMRYPSHRIKVHRAQPRETNPNCRSVASYLEGIRGGSGGDDLSGHLLQSGDGGVRLSKYYQAFFVESIPGMGLTGKSRQDELDEVTSNFLKFRVGSACTI